MADSLLRLPIVDSKANYLDGFWRWVELLAADDYQGALAALHWSRPSTWTPEALKKRITTFYGGPDPWFVVIPNERLINVINDAAEYEPQNKEGWGRLLAQTPLTTEPADPKSDQIPLMGLASSLLIREDRGSFELEREIFHL